MDTNESDDLFAVSDQLLTELGRVVAEASHLDARFRAEIANLLDLSITLVHKLVGGGNFDKRASLLKALWEIRVADEDAKAEMFGIIAEAKGLVSTRGTLAHSVWFGFMGDDDWGVPYNPGNTKELVPMSSADLKHTADQIIGLRKRFDKLVRQERPLFQLPRREQRP